MKDARGHGSNTRGGRSADDAANRLRGQIKYPPKGGFRYPGDPPVQMTKPVGDRLFAGMKNKLADDVAAGRMLASGPKSAPAPVHDAHTGSNYAGKDHPERQYFNYYGTGKGER